MRTVSPWTTSNTALPAARTRFWASRAWTIMLRPAPTGTGMERAMTPAMTSFWVIARLMGSISEALMKTRSTLVSAGTTATVAGPVGLSGHATLSSTVP